MRRVAALPSPWIVVLAVAAAVVVNLAIYGIARLAGADFRFTSPQGPLTVEPVTLIGFSAMPLAIGLTVAAVLGRWWLWVYPVAMIVAPILEIGTIFTMTIPADFALGSKVALAACHVALVPVTLTALGALRRRAASRRSVVAGAVTA